MHQIRGLREVVGSDGYRTQWRQHDQLDADPENIKDPQLKAEYQKKLDSNREYAEYYSQQSRIYGTIDQTAEVLRLNFKEASVVELVNLLVKSGMNASYSDAFLKRMATQVP